MRLIMLFAGLLVLSAGSATAATTFVLDPAHTQIQFAIDRFGFDDVLGMFPAFKGEIILDQKKPENSSVRVMVQIGIVDTNNPKRDQDVPGQFWLDAAHYPQMQFTSTKVVQTSERTARVTGTLTLHGHSHPLTLNVTLNKLGKYVIANEIAVGFSATGAVKRSDFGLDTAVGGIGDVVSIRIEALGVAPSKP